MRVLYTIRGQKQETYSEFKERILNFLNEKLKKFASGSIVLAITDTAPPRFSVIPFRKDLVALISLDGVDQALDQKNWPTPPAGFAGVFISEVAYPVVHNRTWKLGEKSPGSGLLTFFRRKKGLDDEEFLKRWYDGHTVLTLKVHPNVGYVRNRIIDGASREYDGIVEEQYDPSDNLLNPAKFFGGSLLKMIPTMIIVWKDIRGFIDYSSIHTWYTSEYRIQD